MDDRRRIPHWIGGVADATGDATGPVFDPATGRQTAEVVFADRARVDAAVATAREAWPDWRDTPLTRRQRVMFAYREILDAHRLDVAKAITAEHGKTVDDALGEVQRGLEVVDFACNIAHLMKGHFSEQVSTGVDTYTIRQPLGVCAGITPFNFPTMVPLWMFPMATACGNTFILKPSEKDPSPSVLLAEFAREAGLPDGVFNVLHGDKAAVDGLLEHPDVAAVSFVGSTPVARYIYERGSANGKRVQALGGAKNHMVVLPDADMDVAADAAVSAGYGSAGERCMAVSVIVCVGDAGDDLVAAIRDRIEHLRVGPGGAKDSEMGPLITREHCDRVADYVEQGTAEGAELVVDGRGLRIDGYEDGFFLGPSLFDRVGEDMAVYRDEIFGPVLSVVRVPTLDDAIDLIDRNPYGNGTAIFTNDGGAARTFQNRITVGMVGLNIPIPVPLSFYSFGGWKDSMWGAHAIYGPDSVHFYTRQKVVISRWPTLDERGIDLGFPQHG